MTDEPLVTISDPAQDRYARLHLWEDYHRDVIAAAKIMVVGAGALGNEVLKNLALLGAGHLFIVDLDTIEASNLTRSVLFRDTDLGRAKAEVAAERVQALNPDVKAIPFTGDVGHTVGLGVFEAMDVVFGCLDNRAARMALNAACWRLGIPWIDGALHVADGTVRVFIPDEYGACYECLMTKQDYALAHIRYACPPESIMEGAAITTPMAASIIAAMQVQEAVKLLHGKPVTGGTGVYYSAETLRTTQLTYPRRADCPAHKTVKPVIRLSYGSATLTVGQLFEAMREHIRGNMLIMLRDKIVTYCYCPTCDRVDKIYRPYREIVPYQVACSTCQTDRSFDVTIAIGATDATWDVPLAQLGIPALDILTIRERQDYYYVELSGDYPTVFAGWQ